MKRKTIAVCVTGFDWEYETRIVYGIYKRCKELDINVLTFASLMRKPELNVAKVLPQNIIHGEMEIFNLINYEMIDAVIILGDSLLEEENLFKIVERAKAHNIPAINVNDEKHNICHNIVLSDKYAMEAVVRHLVVDHKLTKINFINGFKNNLQSDERLSAYKKVLAENGISYDENRVAYGEFWRKAYDCTAEFMSREDKPQAIVCANDTMAFFCMDYLKENGYNIPNDVVVTGFDAISDAHIYSPTLTTVRRPFEEAGIKAVDLALSIMGGENVPQKTYVDSVLVKNQSCGCVPMNITNGADFCDLRYGELNKFKEFNCYLLEMNTAFTSANYSVEMFKSLEHGAGFFRLNRLYVCICSDVERSKRDFENEKPNSVCGRISREMVSMFSYGHNVPVGERFLSSGLLPENLLEGEKAVFLSFSPMYFKDRFLGYLAYEPTKIDGAGDLFSTWIMAISNDAGSFYMNNELETVVGELENLYIRDPLTGLYNRRGMQRLGCKLINNAKSMGDIVSIICADIDNLKAINDLYGHEAGDNAILQAAKAIEKSFPKESICTRTGGDEYCIMFSHSPDVKIEHFINLVEENLGDYNKISKLPYIVSCSCGSFSIESSKLISIEQMIKIADENMYKIKAVKKLAR